MGLFKKIGKGIGSVAKGAYKGAEYFGDKVLGGIGDGLSDLTGNPYAQAAVGGAMSFVPGMQWYAPMAVGAGMGLAGGGGLDDALQGAGMSGLGYAGGNLGQSAYAGMGSLGSVTGSGGVVPGSSSYAGTPAGIASEFGTEAGSQVGGYAASASNPALVDMPATIGNSLAYQGLPSDSNAVGQARQAEAGFGDPRAARTAPGGLGAAPAGGGGGMFGGGGGGGGKAMMALMAGKAGLGYFQNAEMIDEQEKLRKRQMQALDDPFSVPGMRARRDAASDTWSNAYRAKYGGTEGGAFAKGMARYTDRAVESGVNNYVNTLGGIGAGASKSGAAAGAANQGLTDIMLMQYLNSLNR